MMASLKLIVCPECQAAVERCTESMTAGLAALMQPEAFLDRFPNLFQRDSAGLFDLTDNFGTVMFGNGACGAAARAGNGLISLQPSKLYREFMAAFALQSDFELIDIHGWPVLSLVSRVANVTEAGGVSNLSGGGAA